MIEADTAEPNSDGCNNEKTSNLWPCLASLFVPGFGQFVQKRYAAFFWQLILLSTSICCFYFVGVWGWIAHVPLALYSMLDAAFWNGDVKNRNTVFTRRLFVPIFLFSLMVALMLPAVHAAREAARRMQCTCTYKGIALALHNYHDKYKSLPPAYTVDRHGKPLHSWRVLILPFIEQQKLYDQIRLDEPWDSEYNRQFHSEEIRSFQCPTGTAAAPLHQRFPTLRTAGNCYISVVIGDQTAFPDARSIQFKDITDGTSNTILLVERLLPVCWMDPNHEIVFSTAIEGANRNYNGIGSFHEGVFQAALGDGSVQTYSENIAPDELEALLTIAGGEKVSPYVKR